MKKTISLTKNKLSEILKAVGATCKSKNLLEIADRIKNDESLFNDIMKRIESKKENSVAAQIDVFGTDCLREDIDNLELEDLRTILLTHNLDPSRNVRKWKDREKVIDYIIQTVENKKNKGSIFY